MEKEEKVRVRIWALDLNERVAYLLDSLACCTRTV